LWATSAGTQGDDPLASPAHIDLSGLPPRIIEAGSHEVPRDDAIDPVRPAARARAQVTLTVTAGVPHVLPAFADVLDESCGALERIGTYLDAALPAPTLGEMTVSDEMRSRRITQHGGACPVLETEGLARQGDKVCRWTDQSSLASHKRNALDLVAGAYSPRRTPLVSRKQENGRGSEVWTTANAAAAAS
jgi:hypothetical protein